MIIVICHSMVIAKYRCLFFSLCEQVGALSVYTDSLMYPSLVLDLIMIGGPSNSITAFLFRDILGIELVSEAREL